MLNIFPVLIVVAGMQAVQPIIIQTPELEVELTPRTPNQMGSFYEARGFPRAMPDDKFQIVMINTAEDEDAIFEFLDAIDAEINTLMDADNLVTEV